MVKARRETVNLSEQAYEQLKAMAISFQFRPGERLAEVELATRLKVSRTPIREALHRLVTEGFLAFTPNRGFQGRQLDAKEVFDLYELRRSLEEAAVMLAAGRADDEELEELARLVEKSKAVPNGAPVTTLVSLDEDFHERIAALSRNAELLRVLQNINARIRFCRWIDMENGRRSTTQKEHAEILALLRKRDRERCRAAVSQHIERRLDQIVDVIREGYARIYMGQYTPARAEATNGKGKRKWGRPTPGR
jgi:DNA-binding GntR family transcriptional regulator